MKGTIDDILDRLREDRKAGRTDIAAPVRGPEIREGAYTPLGKNAWRKREKQARKREDQELDRLHRRSLAQAKYHAKNREHLNRIRAIRQRVPLSVYRRARKRASERGQSWLFDFDSWWRLWDQARVHDPVSGFEKPAWTCKGGNYLTDTQMVRRDTTGPWSTANCYIALRGEPVNVLGSEQNGA